MKRPDYRTLQALDAVIRERGFERAAQKLCITQSAVSQRIKQLENMFGQPLLVRTVPPRPTEQGQKLLALLRQVELLEEEWLGDEQTGSTPLLLSLAVNADSLATWLLPALAPVLAPGSVPCHIVNSSEAFVQLARQGTTCCMIPHLQIEKELASGELIDLTPGLFQRRMLYWHRFAPESRMMRKVTDALLDYGHKVLRQD